MLKLRRIGLCIGVVLTIFVVVVVWSNTGLIVVLIRARFIPARYSFIGIIRFMAILLWQLNCRLPVSLAVVSTITPIVGWGDLILPVLFMFALVSISVWPFLRRRSRIMSAFTGCSSRARIRSWGWVFIIPFLPTSLVPRVHSWLFVLLIWRTAWFSASAPFGATWTSILTRILVFFILRRFILGVFLVFTPIRRVRPGTITKRDFFIFWALVWRVWIAPRWLGRFLLFTAAPFNRHIFLTLVLPFIHNPYFLGHFLLRHRRIHTLIDKTEVTELWH